MKATFIQIEGQRVYREACKAGPKCSECFATGYFGDEPEILFPGDRMPIDFLP